jgi:hypothetical protein
MKLGILKQSLSRFPPDMDDLEILIQYVEDNGEGGMDLLVYIALINLKEDMSAICLGTWKAADARQKEHPEQFPPDYKDHPFKHPDSQNEKDQI